MNAFIVNGSAHGQSVVWSKHVPRSNKRNAERLIVFHRTRVLVSALRSVHTDNASHEENFEAQRCVCVCVRACRRKWW